MKQVLILGFVVLNVSFGFSARAEIIAKPEVNVNHANPYRQYVDHSVAQTDNGYDDKFRRIPTWEVGIYNSGLSLANPNGNNGMAHADAESGLDNQLRPAHEWTLAVTDVHEVNPNQEGPGVEATEPHEWEVGPAGQQAAPAPQGDSDENVPEVEATPTPEVQATPPQQPSAETVTLQDKNTVEEALFVAADLPAAAPAAGGCTLATFNGGFDLSGLLTMIAGLALPLLGLRKSRDRA